MVPYEQLMAGKLNEAVEGYKKIKREKLERFVVEVLDPHAGEHLVLGFEEPKPDFHARVCTDAVWRQCNWGPGAIVNVMLER